MEILDEIQPLIVALRRDGTDAGSWAAFDRMVKLRTAEICEGLSTRWLVSVCDTYVDLGTPVERRNAMLVSMLVNMEKVAQSYLMWRTGYDAPFTVPAGIAPRKLRLWDGMTSMHMEIGDVTNNMFRRLHGLQSDTPHLGAILDTVVERLGSHNTILGSIDRHHNHVFDPGLAWREAPRYDRYRENGELPPASPADRGPGS